MYVCECLVFSPDWGGGPLADDFLRVDRNLPLASRPCAKLFFMGRVKFTCVFFPFLLPTTGRSAGTRMMSAPGVSAGKFSKNGKVRRLPLAAISGAPGACLVSWGSLGVGDGEVPLPRLCVACIETA